MNLRERDTQLTELMDDPNCDPETLRRTLQRFHIVNSFVSGWGSVYRSHVRPTLAAARGPVRLLDIGCGAGDVLRGMVRRARSDGFEVSGVGIDPDERAHEVSRAAAEIPGVSYRAAYSHDLVAEGAQFDIVISNHLLHHLDDSEFDGLMADSSRLASRLALHSDIVRGRLAYAAFSLGVVPIAAGTFLRGDGLRSIRRSYTASELAARLPAGWGTEQPTRFRLLAVHRAGSTPQ